MTKGRRIHYTLPYGKTNSFYASLLEQPHILIAGCTGSGKSVFENALIYELLLRPIENGMVLIDPKKVELIDYKNTPHCIAYADEIEDIFAYLRGVVKLMEDRYTDMQKRRLKQFDGGHVYVIIDELADILDSNYREAYPLLQKILQLGRASNIHLWACTQNPSKQLLGTLSKNFTDRIALRCQSAIESRQIINCKGAEDLPRYGECLYLKDGYIYNYEVQKKTDEDIRTILAHWAQYM